MLLSDVYLIYFSLNCYGCSNRGEKFYVCDRYLLKDFFCIVWNYGYDFLFIFYCSIYVRIVIVVNQKLEL